MKKTNLTNLLVTYSVNFDENKLHNNYIHNQVLLRVVMKFNIKNLWNLLKKYKRLPLAENNIVGTLNIACEHGGHAHQIA